MLGTEAVLRAAAQHGTKVLIASTSEVYGKVARLPQCEDDDVLLGPTSINRWSYAAAKMLDEFIGLAYARRGLPVVCFRLFNTVGPRQSGAYGMVVPRFVDAALGGQPLLVHGDGTQSRCFLHVADAVSAIVKLERSEARRRPGVQRRLDGVGDDPRPRRERDRRRAPAEPPGRAERPTATQQAHGEIVLVPYEQAYPDGDFEDIRARQPSVDKLRGLTRWRARHDLEDILRDVIVARTEARRCPSHEEMPVTALA